MSNFTIGRVGIDIDVDSIASWDEKGSRVSIAGRTASGSVPNALVLRQQLGGLVDSPDEDFVPVTWADQPEVNGYYRVISTSVSSFADGSFDGIYLFTCELEKVQGFAAPLIETICLGKTRSLPSGGWGPWVSRRATGIPFSAQGYAEYRTDTGELLQNWPSATREGESGKVDIYSITADSVIQQYYVPASKYYEAAATVLVGAPLRVAVGRQVSNDSRSWKLSNGLIEITPDDSDLLGLKFRTWIGDQWSAWQIFKLGSQFEYYSDIDPFPIPHTFSILSNGPESVTIRLVAAYRSIQSSKMIDITLKRGAYLAEIELHSVSKAWMGLLSPNLGAPPAYQSWNVLGNNRFSQVGYDSVIIVGIADRYRTWSDLPEGTDLMASDGTENTVGGGVQRWALAIGIMPLSQATRTRERYVLEEYFWAGSEKMTVVAR